MHEIVNGGGVEGYRPLLKSVGRPLRPVRQRDRRRVLHESALLETDVELHPDCPSRGRTSDRLLKDQVLPVFDKPLQDRPVGKDPLPHALAHGRLLVEGLHPSRPRKGGRELPLPWVLVVEL